MSDEATKNTQPKDKPKEEPKVQPPVAPTTVSLRYLGTSHVFEDTPTGTVFVRGGEPQSVSTDDAQRLRSYPYEQFEVEA